MARKEEKKKEKKDCPAGCNNGKVKVKELDTSDDINPSGTKLVDADCSTCGGSGKVDA